MGHHLLLVEAQVLEAECRGQVDLTTPWSALAGLVDFPSYRRASCVTTVRPRALFIASFFVPLWRIQPAERDVGEASNTQAVDGSLL